MALPHLDLTLENTVRTHAYVHNVSVHSATTLQNRSLNERLATGCKELVQVQIARKRERRKKRASENVAIICAATSCHESELTVGIPAWGELWAGAAADSSRLVVRRPHGNILFVPNFRLIYPNIWVSLTLHQ